MNWNIEPDPFNILDPAHKPVGADPAGPEHGHQTPHTIGPCEVTTTNPNHCPECLHDYGTGHHACNC